ncbi:MAG: Hsp70 family protein, partial [Chthoniobacterales bacterium]
NPPYLLEKVAGQPVRVVIGKKSYLPEEISAQVLRKLKADAEHALGGTIDRAVITVPAYFNNAQREATKRAGELAGLTVERILSEPTAAALAYGLDRLGENAKVAVYDLGGGTFDISILELNQGVFEVLATHGDTHLGGDDMDAALVKYLYERLEIQNPTEQIHESLRATAEKAKCDLSTQEQTEVLLPFMEEGKSVSCILKRTEMETLIAPLLNPTRQHCRRVLHDAGLTPDAINEIILVGGATRMPMVRHLVHEVFGKPANTTQHPDEAVALGATIQAGILDGSLQNITLLDVTPLSLGIETFGGLMNVIIPRNTTIPAKAGEMFTNAVAAQSGMQITILQGEREMARDNWKLGELAIPFPPMPKGKARVGVQFEIDANGILHVLARDTVTGEEKKLDVKSAVDVADETVEKMVGESVEHAFEDMSERIFTEAKLKAEEMLPAIEMGLMRIGHLLSPEEKAAIDQTRERVREAIIGHQTNALKSAVNELDDVTQNMATLLLESLMDETPSQPNSLTPG